MIRFFGISIDSLSPILLTITGIIIGAVLLLALGNALFFKIGVRNIARRRVQMGLIVFALMLSTTLLSSVLATGDVMTSAVQSVAVYNWGNVDEVIEGGRGPLGAFSQRAYAAVANHARTSSLISAVGASLREQNLLVADQTSRQVRSKVTGLGILPGSEQGFGGMQEVNTKQHLKIEQLQDDQVYINGTLANLLNAKTGDSLYLYAQRWTGQRHAFRVAGIVNNAGLVGDTPYLLSKLQAFQDIESLQGHINQLYIANRGGGGLNGLTLSNAVEESIEHVLPRSVHVVQVKQQGVENSQKAQDIFSRIFSLFSLFALAIGLLLIFLIFVLLAAERRAEMGMARAIGVQRRHLVLMYLFEGTVYDLLSSFVGLLIGLGIGTLVVYLLQPVLLRFQFPLKFTLQPHSLVIAYCLGVIFTFCSVALSAWLVSRMTVAEAMRDLPEPNRSTLTVFDLARRAVQLGRQALAVVQSRTRERGLTTATRLQRVRRLLFEHIPDLLIATIRKLVALGLLPLLIGGWLLRLGLDSSQVIPFSLGVSCIAFGLGLLLKALVYQVMTWIFFVHHRKPMPEPRYWQRASNGVLAILVGAAIVGYWALPFDALARLGLPRFQGGIEVFFVAGMMMVICTIWLLVTNAPVLTSPLLSLCARIPGFYALMKLASAYPLQRRFRTGLNMIMFSLVIFAMTVMAVITNAMQNSYVDIDTQTGGYDIQASAYFKPLPDIQATLAAHGVDPHAFAAIGRSSTTAVGVIQLTAEQPRWSLYPAQFVSGGFLQGYGLRLAARANGFASDNDIWQALQQHPDYALIDSSSVPYDPNGNGNVYDPTVPRASDAGVPALPPNFDAKTTFTLSGVYQGQKTFSAAPIWVAGLQGREARKLTIIGIVDNSDSAHFGLYISRTAYSEAAIGNTVDETNPQSESYYFKVAPGQDKRTLALALGSAFLDNGLETTVLEDAIWQVRGPRILLSNVLLGVVGMTLLLGVAALAITGTRAVIERRQQIGMLRAVGCSRGLVRGAFLLESFLVGVVGSFLGILLGLNLARNIFAANFFEQYQTGLLFSIPWSQLWFITGLSLLASLLGAILPAWQAGKIAPAEALRYV